MQIGNLKDMNAESESGELARQVLDEYMQTFQERNPYLRVFSARLHMDEATPHLHIDFVPFTTGSKRGLDTRVSLKQALAAQGFKGGTRGDTEWNQWVLSEKEQLAKVMERHGIEWEHKGTHEQHLGVLDYKKQEREKEVAILDEQIAAKKDEVVTLGKRVQNFDGGLKELQKVEQALDFDEAFQLPEPPALMTAKTYKAKFAEPLIKKLKSLVKKVLARCFEALDNYHRLNVDNGRLYRTNKRLSQDNDRLKDENDTLKAENRDYKLLRKVFGSRKIDDLLEQARTAQQSKQREKRFRNQHYDMKGRKAL